MRQEPWYFNILKLSVLTVRLFADSTPESLICSTSEIPSTGSASTHRQLNIGETVPVLIVNSTLVRLGFMLIDRNP